MKLITYDETVSQRRKSGSPTITFSKSGLISLSAHFCEKIGLNEGDKVLIHQNSDNPQDWYLSKSKEGFQVRKSSGQAKAMAFNCSRVCEDFRESLELEKQSVKCRMAIEPVAVGKEKYYAIITANIQ